LRVEMGKADASHIFQYFNSVAQTGLLAARQVDLGRVAGNDCRGTEAYSREEHLHLFAGGVLAHIKDHEGVVQGPATHERQGRHFDNSALHQFAYGFKSEHLEQSVIKGTQVRVNFLGEVARQKSQLLASFHSGTHQQDEIGRATSELQSGENLVYRLLLE